MCIIDSYFNYEYLASEQEQRDVSQHYEREDGYISQVHKKCCAVDSNQTGPDKND